MSVAEQPLTRGRRLLVFYLVMAVVVGVVAAIAITAGEREEAETPIAGGYDVTAGADCLGDKFDVKQSGRFVNLTNPDETLGGKLELRDGDLTGDVSCLDGGTAELDARADSRTIEGRLDGRRVAAEFKREPPEPGTAQGTAPDSIEGEYSLTPRSDCLGGSIEVEGSGSEVVLLRGASVVAEASYEDGRIEGTATCPEGGETALTGDAVDRKLNLTIEDPPERLTADKRREPGSRFAAFFIAIAVVMLVARLFGVVAQLGLIFYMFLVGLEIDASQLRGRLGQVAAISNTSVALPMILGMLVALPIYELIGPDESFAGFALFMGVSMSITAFPVLARILVERRMLKRPIGAMALACAAIDDVTAWFLIALATAVAGAGSGGEVIRTIALAVAFCLVMGFLVRPLVARVSTAYDEAGRVPGGWVALIFAGVLLSAYATEEIGIALIFGAFVMGLIMPRHAELTEDVTGRIEDFVVTLLLPLFFAFTGLRTNIGLLDRPELWIMTGVLLVTALLGKLFGATLAARISGLDWRSSAVIGVLMNTRGLTELIVLNLALEKGVISEALFAMLVIMALVTTFMAGPLLKLLDPKNELGAPVEEELDEARQRSSVEFPALPPPQEAILVAQLHEAALDQLLSLAEPLARSEPPRELIVARLVRPPRGAGVRGGLQTENRLLSEASAEVSEAREELMSKAIAARAVAFVSADPGADLARLAHGEEVALVLLDGRRPLLGQGVPRGDVGEVLREAPGDVGVLVAREGASVLPGPGAPLVVPFGGVEHDWAALELGAWISAATD